MVTTSKGIFTTSQVPGGIVDFSIEGFDAGDVVLVGLEDGLILGPSLVNTTTEGGLLREDLTLTCDFL